MKNHKNSNPHLLNRRQFLKSSSGTIASLAMTSFLLPHQAQATFLRTLFRPARPGTEKAPGFFILLTTNGGAGLDVTLGLDPMVMAPGLDEKDIFIEYRPEDIFSKGEIRLGPSAKPLIEHVDSFSIVNGIMMRRDSGHGQLLEYMQTGDTSGNAGAMSSEFAGQYLPTAFGNIYKAFSVKAPPFEVATTAFESLNEKLSSADFDVNASLPLDDTQNSDLADVFEAYRLAGKKVPEMKKILESLPHSTSEDSLNRTVAAAFLAGAAASAHIQIDTTQALDTHSNHEKIHLTGQTEFWNKISDLFTLFKKIPYAQGSLFDATTFYVTSEFARTPALNTALGKDHNPFTNSTLIAGRGVQTGKVFGASHVISRKKTEDQMPLHIGFPYDFKRNEVVRALGVAEATMIYPENVVAAIRKGMGLPGNAAKALPGLMK